MGSVVEHWEALAAASPDIWERFSHSPIIATELAKAGKAAYAVTQTHVFEDAVRTGKQLEVDDVRALIALHGRSALLRDLFIARLQHFFPGRPQTMMVLERAAYQAMASYLAHHFHGDAGVGEAMIAVASSGMIQDVGLIALCRGWPDSPPIAAAIPELPRLVDAMEPFAAWLISSKADAALMAKYLVRYPDKLIRDHLWEARDGILAVRARLQSDRECREAVFAELQKVSGLTLQVALVKLLAPSMRDDTQFRTWISDRVRAGRQGDRVLSELVFDVIAKVCRPVEFILLETVLTRLVNDNY